MTDEKLNPGPSEASGGVVRREGEPYRHLRDAVDAVATAAENTATVFRDRAYSPSITDQMTLLAVAHGWDQFAVELREISSGESFIRSTTDTSHASDEVPGSPGK